jgi:hypothetical protein
MLYPAGKDIVGRRLPIQTIHSLITKQIKSFLPVKVTSNRGTDVRKNYIFLAGLYDSVRDKKKYTRHIEILLHYNTYQESLKLTLYKWRRICRLFSDIVLHEVVHMRQFRARNFKTIPIYASTAAYAKERKQQEYYGDTDEMGAFAFNIACDLYDRFSDKFHLAKRYLESDSYRRHPKSDWRRYMEAFNHNHNHKIIRRMKRKIINQLPNAQIGKPFRTSDHLTY